MNNFRSMISFIFFALCRSIYLIISLNDNILKSIPIKEQSINRGSLQNGELRYHHYIRAALMVFCSNIYLVVLRDRCFSFYLNIVSAFYNIFEIV
jgi:hypothetical protein